MIQNVECRSVLVASFVVDRKISDTLLPIHPNFTLRERGFTLSQEEHLVTGEFYKIATLPCLELQVKLTTIST